MPRRYAQLGGRTSEVGDPAATAGALLALVDADDPPLRLHLGRSLPAFEADLAARLNTYRAWSGISQAAFGARTPG